MGWNIVFMQAPRLPCDYQKPAARMHPYPPHPSAAQPLSHHPSPTALPPGCNVPLGSASQLAQVQEQVWSLRLNTNTICEQGRFPNRGERYATGTATFLPGGSICTRSCAFCQVHKGQVPQPLDAKEADRVVEAGWNVPNPSPPGPRIAPWLFLGEKPGSWPGAPCRPAVSAAC